MPVPVATIRVITFMQELHEQERKFGALRSQDDTSVVMCNDQSINSVHIQRSHSSISTPPLLLFP